MNWLQEGREVGVTLDATHAVVVLGSDPVATSEVALGIARMQAQHRRVVVADMFGDAPPLQALVSSDDPHGLVDSFLYGVSLNRITHPVPDAGALFIMPSGTGPLDYDELFASPRWRKLATEFAADRALLLIVAPASAPHIRSLVESTDGAVLVGDSVPAELPVAASLAWIRSRRTAPMTVAVPLPPAQSRPTGIEPLVPAGAWQRYAGPGAGILAVLTLAALALWFANRPLRQQGTGRAGIPAASMAATAVTGGALSADGTALRAPDSVRLDSISNAGGAAVPSDSFPTLAVSNPQDSAAAVPFSVLLEETLTKSGAILNLEQKFKMAPVSTFGVNPRTRFFPVYTGAYNTRATADSLLADLRANRLLPAGAGSVVRVPYAFLVQSDVPADAAVARVAFFRASGLPVYALRQPNGAAHLYFGAYAGPQQAALAVPEVRKAKVTPVLAYRIGRVF
jgi:hypothetical protein